MTPESLRVVWDKYKVSEVGLATIQTNDLERQLFALDQEVKELRKRYKAAQKRKVAAMADPVQAAIATEYGAALCEFCALKSATALAEFCALKSAQNPTQAPLA